MKRLICRRNFVHSFTKMILKTQHGLLAPTSSGHIIESFRGYEQISKNLFSDK